MISGMMKISPLAGMKIGLFGGSFNPAHQGHLELAKFALAKLQLDYVWWMVSPQNPLKPAYETKDFEARIRTTEKLARHPKFIVTGLERSLQTTTTAQTLEKLQPVLSKARFVWLMGADSFAGLHHWNDWRTIPYTLPIAVFDRPGWTAKSLAGTAAKSFKACQVNEQHVSLLPYFNTPAWGFVPMPQRPESSTSLRAQTRSGK